MAVAVVVAVPVPSARLPGKPEQATHGNLAGYSWKLQLLKNAMADDVEGENEGVGEMKMSARRAAAEPIGAVGGYNSHIGGHTMIHSRAVQSTG